MTTAKRFDIKDTLESVPLTFDFSPGLATSETLLTISAVTISVVFGTDATPTTVLAGGNFIDSTSTKIVVPVTAGLDGVDYDIKVKATTSTATKTLSLAGILPVRAQ